MIFIFFTRSEVGKPNTLFCPEFKYVVSFLFLSGKVVKVTRGWSLETTYIYIILQTVNTSPKKWQWMTFCYILPVERLF